jgi:hypothetical protein
VVEPVIVVAVVVVVVVVVVDAVITVEVEEFVFSANVLGSHDEGPKKNPFSCALGFTFALVPLIALVALVAFGTSVLRLAFAFARAALLLLFPSFLGSSKVGDFWVSLI